MQLLGEPRDHFHRVERMRTINALALIGVMAVLGCATVPVAATVVVQPGKRVTAEASKFSPLWLSPLPTETSSELLDDLLDQCDGAGLTGVTITTSVAWAFIGQVEKIRASAYCVEPGPAGPVGEASSTPDSQKELNLMGLGGVAMGAQ